MPNDSLREDGAERITLVKGRKDGGRQHHGAEARSDKSDGAQTSGAHQEFAKFGSE